jgi:hypothetical protein
MRVMRGALLLPVWLATVALALAGCGGDDEPRPAPDAPAPARAAPSPQPSPGPAEPGRKPGRNRIPKPETLTGCLREVPRVERVLVKGSDSEDARFFEQLVGGRVTALAITLAGQAAEVSVFVFGSAADAREAAPDAGGAGLEVTVHGTAVLVAPPAAETAAVAACLARGR